MEEQCSRPRALRIRTMRGEPISAGGRELIPVARVVSFGRASATVGSGQISGGGGGFAWIKPLAVVEVTDTVERRVDLRDESAKAIQGMLAYGIAIGLVCTAIRWLVRQRRRGSQATG